MSLLERGQATGIVITKAITGYIACCKQCGERMCQCNEQCGILSLSFSLHPLFRLHKKSLQ